jgi:HD-GYP domain-containing protein (c-di-GMP phosphodiesterase class II)
MPSVPVDRLQPGVFISLESVLWMEHPFLRSRFRITDLKQIQALRRVGITSVEWDPEKSTASPLPEAASDEADFSQGTLAALLDDKRDRIERIRDKREDIARCARLFEQETAMIRQVFGELGPRPGEAHLHSRGIVDRLVGNVAGASSVAVHLVNIKKPEVGPPNHAMNVMVLSLLIGKTLGLPEEEMRSLGVGAMLHDVGLAEIPSRVQRNANRSDADEKFYRAHTGYGLKVVAPIKDLAVAIKNIIACHHERWDGQGYPNGLAGTRIPKLARIVAIANRYDNLCNPLDPKNALTPSEAVAQMFKLENDAFEPEVLSAFVKALGVYPPGTFVALNDGSFGLVIESRSSDLLRPLLMLYDASVPRQEALLLDIVDAAERIEGAVRPRDLPREVIEYLAPQGRVDFYLEGAG